MNIKCAFDVNYFQSVEHVCRQFEKQLVRMHPTECIRKIKKIYLNSKLDLHIAIWTFREWRHIIIIIIV